MSISCHFRDCKALLITSLTYVTSAIISLYLQVQKNKVTHSRRADKRTDTETDREYTVTENSQKQSLNIGLQMILEVQRYRSFHAKCDAILRFILVLKIFHKVIESTFTLTTCAKRHKSTPARKQVNCQSTDGLLTPV